LGIKESKVFINGLDAAGKTSMLYWLKLGELVCIIRTVGFNVEKVQIGRVEFTLWDVGGGDKIKPLKKHYYHGCTAAIFVIDSSDE